MDAAYSDVVPLGFVTRQIFGLREPLDRARQAASEAVQARVLRAPAEEGRGLPTVGPQTFDLAAGRTQPRLVRFDRDVLVHQLGNLPDGVADRDLVAPAQVHGLADARRGGGCGNEARDDVVDVVEVAGRRQRAKAEGALSGGDLR